jgi:hypothetical protein
MVTIVFTTASVLLKSIDVVGLAEPSATISAAGVKAVSRPYSAAAPNLTN